MRALLLLLVFFFLNFTPDDGPPKLENKSPYSENLLTETQTLFVPEDNRGRFLVKPKGNYQPMQFCNLIPGQTYTIFAVRGKTCVPKVSMGTENPTTTFDFVAEDECMDFTYYAGMCQEPNYISIGCKSCKKDNSFMQDFMLSVSGASDQFLVEDVFIGGNCFDITNISGIGPAEGRGQFSGGSFGLTDGVVLSSGNINNLPGNNMSESSGNNMGGAGGDPDLNILGGGLAQFDNEGIEFDFTPTIPVLDFLFVFGSEEYCEYVGTGFNDVFGFFISGPGISGPYSSSGINIGTIPGGVPITINTVNPTSNSTYFIPNSQSCGITVNGAFSLDGYTSVVQATANVIPCNTYHIKLIISDLGDGIFDSAVFLGAGSFNAGGTASTDTFSPIGATMDVIYEDCPQGGFVFERVGLNLNSLITLNVTVDPSSTATPGVDYQPLPPTVIIPPGATEFFLPVSVFSDGIPEGAESIILTLDNPCSCSADEVTLWIEEPPEVFADLPDATLCAAGVVTLEPTVSGGIQNPQIYTYLWDDGSQAPIYPATPTQTTTYTVTVTDFCGTTAEAESTIEVFPLPIVTLQSGVEFVCDAFNEPTLLEISVESGIESMPIEIVISQDGAPLDPPLVINPGDPPPYYYEVFGTGQFEIFSVTNGTDNQCDGVGGGFYQITEIEIDAELEATNVGCAGANDGTIQVNADGVPPFTYTWSNGLPDTTTYADNLEPGLYIITVTDSEGCEVTVQTDILDGEDLDAVAEALTIPNCINPNGGSAEVDVIGGNPMFTFDWSNGAIGQTVTGLMPGSYTVTVTDQSNCSAIADVFIDDDTTPPIAVANPDGLIDCLNDETTVNGDGSDEGSNITYQWSGPGIVSGGTTLYPTVNMPGTYTIVVTNEDNGCTEEDMATVIQDETPPTAVVNPPPQIDCANPQITIDGTGSSSNGNFSYQWSTPNGNIVNGATTLFPEIDMEGTYVLIVTNEDNGCTEMASDDVTSNMGTPDADAGPSQLISCNAASVNLDGSGSSQGANYTYEWVTNNGTIVSGGTTLTPEVSEAGTYEIIVTDITNGCTESATVEVDLNSDVPTADAGDDQTLDCTIANLILDATNSSSGGTITFEWTTNGGNFVSGQTTLTPEIDSPGEYILTVSDSANGCTAVSTVVVDENLEQPMIDILPPEEINCDFPTITIDGSNSTNTGNIQITWNTDDGNIIGGENTLTPEVDMGGTYQLTILNQDNGCEETDSISVTLNTDTPDAVIADPNALTCTDTEITIDATGSNGNGPLVYSWTTSDGTIVSGDDSLTPVVSAEGTYDLLITNTASNCTATASITVAEDNELPTADAGQTLMIDCDNPQVVLDGTVTGTGNLEITWSTADGSIVSGGNTSTPTVDAGGTYVLDVLNIDNGCTATASVTISEDANIPEADIVTPEMLTCDITSLTLDGTNSTQGGTVQFSWSTSDGNFSGGQNTLTPTINQPGTYTLSIFDNSNNCENTTSVTVSEDLEAPTVAAAAGQLDCANTIADLDGTGSSTTGNFTYEWLSLNGNTITNPNDILATVTEPGDYILRVTNTDNGCYETIQVEVTQDINDPDAVAENPPQITCATDVVIINGTQSSLGADFEYLWTTPTGSFVSGENTLLPNVNSEGVYELTVTDLTNGCTATTQVTVTENIEFPDANAGPTGLISCENETLNLDGSGSSTGGVFDILWTTGNGIINSGETTSNPEIASGGTYEIIVTDLTNGCSSVDQVVIDENFDTPMADAGQTQQLSCSVDELTLDGTLSSAGGNISYEWSTSNGVFTSAQNIVNPTVSSAGTYILTVTNTDSGCTESASVDITQDDNAPDAIIALPDTITCLVSSVVLDGSASTTGAGITYQWSTTDGDIVSGTDGLIAWAGAPGTYVLTVNNGNNDCISQASVTVTTNLTPPDAEAGNTQELTCLISVLSLNALGSSTGTNFSYNWTTTNGNIVGGANTTSPVIDAPGVYQIEVTNTWTGCTATDEVTVTQSDDLPIATALPPNKITCAVSEVIIDGSGSSTGFNFAYFWTTVDGIILDGATTLTPTVGSAGTYVLQVTDGTNGCDNTFSITVEEDMEEPLVQAGNDVVLTCTATSIDLNGNGSAVGPNFIYQWSGPGNIFGDDSLTPTVTESGVFSLVVTNIENGCSAQDFVNVNEDMNTPDVVIANPDVLDCQVFQISVDGTGSSTGTDFDYEWTTSDGNIVSGANTLTIEVDEPGTYELLITNNDNGCTETGNIVVNQDLAPPTASAGDDFTRNCLDDAQPLDGSGSSGGNLSYDWTTSDGDIVSGANTQNPDISSGGIYLLVVTNNDNGCTDSDEVEVFEDAPVTEVSLNQPVCEGDEGSVSFELTTGGIPPYTYSVDGGQTFGTETFHSGIQSGDYTVIVQDANGCEDEHQVTIVEPQIVTIDLAPEVTIQWGNQTQIEALTNIPSNEIQSIEWSPSEGLSCTDCLDPIATPNQTTVYGITITTDDGCQQQGEITIHVSKDLNVYIPNGFSPNNDGVNDVFMIHTDGNTVTQVQSFMIFNRWGETVFQQFNFLPDDPAHGWDGVHRGEKTNAAVYVWFALIEFIDGSVELYEGDVTVTK